MTDETVRPRRDFHADGYGLEELITRLIPRFVPENISGQLMITTPSGRVWAFGENGSYPAACIDILSWKVLLRALKRGAIGFAESYICGEVKTRDPVALVRFFARNREALLKSGGWLFRSGIANRIGHLLRSNSRNGSRKNIAAHYDLGNEFFALWLDESMTYSSALYRSDTDTLPQAQKQKYDRIIDALDLKKGANILEIGCGWGGFAERVLSRKACHITGLTLSKRQLEYATRRIKQAGYEDRAHFRYQDYRDCQGRYDALVSIEMIEAVGENNWALYFDTLNQRLKPGGQAVLQAITIRPDCFELYRRKADFIQSYIFPGGMLPTPMVIMNQARHAGFIFETIEQFGPSYAQTLAVWSEQFKANWKQLEQMGFDETFRNTWNWYLAYCEGGFREGTIDVGIFRLTKTA